MMEVGKLKLNQNEAPSFQYFCIRVFTGGRWRTHWHFSLDASLFFTPCSFPSTTRKRVGIYLEREKTNMRIYKKKAIAVVIVLRDKRGGAIEKKTKCRRADGDSNK